MQAGRGSVMSTKCFSTNLMPEYQAFADRFATNTSMPVLEKLSALFHTYWDHNSPGGWSHDWPSSDLHMSYSDFSWTLPDEIKLPFAFADVLDHFDDVAWSDLSLPLSIDPLITVGFKGIGTSEAGDAQATYETSKPLGHLNMMFGIPTVQGPPLEGHENAKLPEWTPPLGSYSIHDLSSLGKLGPLADALTDPISGDTLSTELTAWVSTLPGWGHVETQLRSWGENVKTFAHEIHEEIDFSNIDNLRNNNSETVDADSGAPKSLTPYSTAIFEFADPENSTLADVLGSKLQNKFAHSADLSDKLSSTQFGEGSFGAWALDEGASSLFAGHSDHGFLSGAGTLLSSLSIDDDVSETSIS